MTTKEIKYKKVVIPREEVKYVSEMTEEQYNQEISYNASSYRTLIERHKRVVIGTKPLKDNEISVYDVIEEDYLSFITHDDFEIVQIIYDRNSDDRGDGYFKCVSNGYTWNSHFQSRHLIDLLKILETSAMRITEVFAFDNHKEYLKWGLEMLNDN